MHSVSRRLTSFVLAVGIATSPFTAQADDGWRTNLLEENDSLYFHTDKHYTQGLRLSLLSPVLREESWADELFDFAKHIPTVFAENEPHTRRDSLFFGQSVFTPENLDIKPPSPRDRPYGGWLYGGASMLQETGRQLENFEVDVGVVGPGALGKQVQNDWHQFIGIHQAKGWSDQIQNEPG